MRKALISLLVLGLILAVAPVAAAAGDLALVALKPGDLTVPAYP